MKAKPFGCVAAGIGAIVLAGAVAGSAQSASAAAPQAKSASVRSALALKSHVGSFPSIAVVRGSNNGVWATTGSGFVNLGGRTFEDPAVASASGNQIYFLAKGTNSLLYFRDLDSGWKLVENSPTLGTDLTAAFSAVPPTLQVSYRDTATTRVHHVVLGSLGGPQPIVTSDVAGPVSYGAAINSSGRPLFVGDAYTPGLLGQGTLRQWDGINPVPPSLTDKRFLNCARERLGTALFPGGPNSPVGVAVCKSGTGDSVHFLGNVFVGYGTGRDLGGHIIGSPGVALESALRLSSVVYATGTNHHVFATTVNDLGGIFSQGPWVDLGGYAVHGVQASSWTIGSTVA
jgi:hypothetical protein